MKEQKADEITGRSLLIWGVISLIAIVCIQLLQAYLQSTKSTPPRECGWDSSLQCRIEDCHAKGGKYYQKIGWSGHSASYCGEL